MKLIIQAILLLLLCISTPVWAIRTVTVGELEDLMRTMHQQNKSDAEVANALKQLQLSEQLTVARMNELVAYVPGRLTTEQVYVLEARSADLAPPPADLPKDPAPDQSTQKAILTKAANYVTSVYESLPSLSVTKTTLRFQDNVEALAANSGLAGGVTDVVTTSSFNNASSFIHFINSTEATVSSDRGTEKPSTEKDKTVWGANRMIALKGPDPSLSVVFQQAQSSGTLQFSRWELVNGKKVAVFAFSVSKKKAHLPINVCCFPNVAEAGIARFYNATTGAALGGSGGGGGVIGNMQTSTNWHPFKSTVPYHGLLYIEPSTGIVVRMITEPELKQSDVVHQVDTRVDYGPVQVGKSVLILPVKTFINTLVVPNGDSQAGGYTTRCTLFTSEYKNYQVVSGK